MAFPPVGIQQRSEVVTGRRGTRNKEGGNGCVLSAKGPVKIAERLAPPETPRGCISTVLYSRDTGVYCS